MLWLVLGLALRGSLGDASGVQRCGYPYDDVGCEQLGSVVGTDGNTVFDLCLADLIDNGMDLEGQVDVLGRSVSHELKLAIWRYEGYYSVRVKLSELDALVELAILQRDTAGCCPRRLCACLVARRLV